LSKLKNEKFSFTLAFGEIKPPIDFFAQNSVQFGRRAERGDYRKLDFSLLAAGLGLEELPEGYSLAPLRGARNSGTMVLGKAHTEINLNPKRGCDCFLLCAPV